MIEAMLYLAGGLSDASCVMYVFSGYPFQDWWTIYCPGMYDAENFIPIGAQGSLKVLP